MEMLACGFEAGLKEAWRLRFLQRNREVAEMFPVLRKALQESLPDVAVPRNVWNLDLLRVSLLRADGQLELAKKELTRVTKEMKARSLKPPFQFYLQKALNVFMSDDFATALEFFLLADSQADLRAERMVCLMNVLTCLENLNRPVTVALSTIEELLAESAQEAAAQDRELEASVRRQLTFVYQRKFFRDGDLARMLACALPDSVDQSHFFRLMITRLGYTRVDQSKLAPQLQKLAEAYPDRPYRLKTALYERPKPGDLSGTLTMQVERIYSWTWKWLTEPSATQRENLAACLTELDYGRAFKKMTFEEFQMLRAALSWIGLFQKNLRPWIDDYLGRAKWQAQCPIPIFDFELAAIAAIVAERSQLSVSTENDLSLQAFAHKDELRLLEHADRWRSEWRERKNAGTRRPIFINLESCQVTFAGLKTVSAPVARVMAALSIRKSLTFAEALQLGFDVAPYEHSAHTNRIHNLLARIKLILAKAQCDVTVTTKAFVINWTGESSCVEIFSPHALEIPLFDKAPSFTLVPNHDSWRDFDSQIEPRGVVDRAGGLRELAEVQIQSLLGFSKARTARWITHWVDQGLIVRVGNGRSGVYHIDIPDNYRLKPT